MRYLGGGGGGGGTDTDGMLHMANSSGVTLAAGQTRYLTDATIRASESNVQIPAPFNCTAQNLYAEVETAIPAGESAVITFRLNGADTALTCTIAALSKQASDTGNTVNVTAGDLFCIKWVASNNGGFNNRRVSQIVEFVKT